MPPLTAAAPTATTGSPRNTRPAAWRRKLVDGASIELAPRQLASAPLERLRPGTEVYVPHPPNAAWRDSVAACRHLAATRLTPVPHLTARGIESVRDLDDRLAQLTDAGVYKLLLIAGDRTRPAGPFQDTLAVLDSGRLTAHGIGCLSCAIHPERHPHANADALRAALNHKIEYARQTHTELTLVTQFAFTPQPILAWLAAFEGPDDAPLQVRVGLPGPAKLATLIRFAARCGIGTSAKVLTHRPDVVRLLGPWSPDGLMDALVQHLSQAPGSALAGIHLFPFGGLASSCDWLRHQRALDGDAPCAAATAHRPGRRATQQP